MRKWKAITIISGLLVTSATFADVNTCAKSQSIFQTEMKNMWDCSRESWTRYSYSSASASEVASAVNYECSQKIRKLAEAQYDSSVCEMAVKSGRKFSDVARNLPPKGLEVEKSEKDIKAIVSEKVIAETVKYRANK